MVTMVLSQEIYFFTSFNKTGIVSPQKAQLGFCALSCPSLLSKPRKVKQF